MGPLLFSIHINHLSNRLQSNPKLLADDTSLFSRVEDVTTSTGSLKNDLTNKLDFVQYDAALAITGAIRGSSREKFYEELGLESLE